VRAAGDCQVSLVLGSHGRCHKSTHVTETVYRHVIVPAIRRGATVIDDVFGDDPDQNN
jgi:hypothetical protein